MHSYTNANRKFSKIKCALTEWRDHVSFKLSGGSSGQLCEVATASCGRGHTTARIIVDYIYIVASYYYSTPVAPGYIAYSKKAAPAKNAAAAKKQVLPRSPAQHLPHRPAATSKRKRAKNRRARRPPSGRDKRMPILCSI